VTVEVSRHFTLKMEEARSSETFIFYHNATRGHNSEDHVLKIHSLFTFLKYRKWFELRINLLRCIS